MLREVVEALAPRDGGIYVDGTFGRGGYSRAILEAGETSVIGIDRDPEAIEAGASLLRRFGKRLRLLHGAFGDMRALLAKENIGAVDGVTFDLGVSSPQLDDASRGFSFQEDGPLDMRMSREGATAADLVNKASERELADIVFHFGEERFARRVARALVAARKEKALTRTSELAKIVRAAVPRSKDGLDPATRTFQALRIAVNDELGELQRGLLAAEAVLKPSGRLAVVSFHSLEDRCVKDFMRGRSASAPRASRHAPDVAAREMEPVFRLLTRKPIAPAADEMEANPRSRSARLRVAERTDALAPMENAA